MSAGWADPEAFPGWMKIGETSKATYQQLIKWQALYENIVPGKHVTGEHLKQSLQYCKLKKPKKKQHYLGIKEPRLSRPTSTTEEKKAEGYQKIKENEGKKSDVSDFKDLECKSLTPKEYQWNLVPSRHPFLRKPISKAIMPQALAIAPLPPPEKLLDSLRTNSFTTFGDPKRFFGNDLFPLMVTIIPRRRRPEDSEKEVDQEDCFFALPTPPLSALNFFEDVPGWDVDEDISYLDLPTFSSHTIESFRADPRQSHHSLRQTQSLNDLLE